MSHARTRSFWPVLALLAVGGLTLAVAARADVLDDFKKNREIAAQKVEKELEQAMLEVQKIKVKEPTKALGILNTYKDLLEADTHLSTKRRNELLQSVGQQIQLLQKSAKVQPSTTSPKTKPNVEDLYSKYQQAGSGKAQPPSSFDTASKLIKDNKSNLDMTKDFNTQKKKTVSQVFNNTMDIGEVPANGYVAFSKDWKKISDKRFELSGLKLTPQEASLMKAMNSVLSVDFNKNEFRQVIDYLSERTGQSIVVDPVSLKELQLEYNTPITFKANKITFRTALKKILGDVGLAYILKDGVVQVVTPQVAANTMTTKSYYIGDLLPVPDIRFGPLFNQSRDQYFANQVMQMILMTVEPQSWAMNGGQGTIFFNPVTKTVVIRNSAELHLSIKSSMGR